MTPGWARAVGGRVYHFWPPRGVGPFVVVALCGARARKRWKAGPAPDTGPFCTACVRWARYAASALPETMPVPEGPPR